MDDADNSTGPAGQIDIHEPFTKAERFQQLSEIDNDITSLLAHTGRAIQALSKSPSDMKSGNDGDAPSFDAQERLNTFKEAMDSFTAALDSVDKRLKRQIYGLEEAGIITLKSTEKGAGEGRDGSGSGPGASGIPDRNHVEPNGVGKVGPLDVGWLNANSSTVERDKEIELWTKLREHLERVASEQDRKGEKMQE